MKSQFGYRYIIILLISGCNQVHKKGQERFSECNKSEFVELVESIDSSLCEFELVELTSDTVDRGLHFKLEEISLVTVDSGGVYIECKNSSVHFINAFNDSDETAEIRQTYLGFEPKSEVYLVEENQWEQTYYHFLSRTGNMSKATSLPKISPDGQFLFVKQSDNFRLFDESSLGFKIYRTEKMDLIEVVNFKSHYVTEGRWTKDNSLKFWIRNTDLEKIETQELLFQITPTEWKD